MKDKTVEKIIPKLIASPALDYDLKRDGLLVVIDAAGKKHSFKPDAYLPLLTPNRSASKPKSTHHGGAA